MISSFFHPGTSYSKNDKRRLLYEKFFASLAIRFAVLWETIKQN